MNAQAPFFMAGEVLALSSSFIYSAALISFRRGLRSASPITGVLITNAVASILLLSIAFSLGTLQTSSLRPVLWFMLAGCLGQGMGHLASYTAIQRIGASRTSPVQASAPIWAVFFAAFFLGEEPGVAVVLGTLSIVGGVALISMGESKDVAKGGMGPEFRRALMFPVFASFMYAAMPVIAKIGYAEQRTPFAAVGFAFLAGFLFLLVAKPFLGASGRIHVGRRDVSWILLGSVFSATATGLLWYTLTFSDVTVVLPLSRTAPIWVVLLSLIFMGDMERVNARLFGAAGLVVLGGFLITSFR